MNESWESGDWSPQPSTALTWCWSTSVIFWFMVWPESQNDWTKYLSDEWTVVVFREMLTSRVVSWTWLIISPISSILGCKLCWKFRVPRLLIFTNLDWGYRVFVLSADANWPRRKRRRKDLPKNCSHESDTPPTQANSAKGTRGVWVISAQLGGK